MNYKYGVYGYYWDEDNLLGADAKAPNVQLKIIIMKIWLTLRQILGEKNNGY